MAVVDTQVHIWSAEDPGAALAHRPTLLGQDELPRDMDAADVDHGIIVPPLWEGGRNDLAMEVALLHPDRFAVIGR
jgi:predicted TIM-barrel fold metal-dependent hydrolase